MSVSRCVTHWLTLSTFVLCLAPETVSYMDFNFDPVLQSWRFCWTGCASTLIAFRRSCIVQFYLRND